MIHETQELAYPGRPEALSKPKLILTVCGNDPMHVVNLGSERIHLILNIVRRCTLASYTSMVDAYIITSLVIISTIGIVSPRTTMNA